VIDIATPVIMCVFFASVTDERCRRERTETVLIVQLDKVVVVIGLGVSTVAVAVVDVYDVVTLVNIESRWGSNWLDDMSALSFFLFYFLVEKAAFFGLKLAGQSQVAVKLALFFLFRFIDVILGVR